MNEEKETKKKNPYYLELACQPRITKEEEQKLSRSVKADLRAGLRLIVKGNQKFKDALQALSNFTNVKLSELFVQYLKDYLGDIYYVTSHIVCRELNEEIDFFETKNDYQKLFAIEDGDKIIGDKIIDADDNEIMDFGVHGSVVIDKDNEHLYPKCKNKTTKTSK